MFSDSSISKSNVIHNKIQGPHNPLHPHFKKELQDCINNKVSHSFFETKSKQ